MAKERAYPSVGDKWAAELVERIGSAMKRARSGGRSAAWLSKRTEELGYRVSPTVISKLDSGHRGGVLSVPELLVIAAALETPALDLLFSDEDKQVFILPGVSVTPKAAQSLFAGHDLECVEVRVDEVNDILRQAIEERQQAIESQRQANSEMQEAVEANRRATEAFNQAAEALREAVEIRQQMNELLDGPSGSADDA